MPHTCHNAQPTTFPFILSPKDYFIHNKYHKVLLCVSPSSRQLYPPVYTRTTSSKLCSRTHSADVLPCHAICFLFTHIFVSTPTPPNGTVGALWYIRSLAAFHWSGNCVFCSCIRLWLSYPAVFTRATSYLVWIQTHTALWLLDWHQSEHKWIRYYWL